MISIILPTFNEAGVLPKLFNHLKKNIGKNVAYEILVCDAGSKDGTIDIAESFGAKVFYSSLKNRAFQMNMGAQKAKGEILYFLHADTLPPASFGTIINSYFQKGYDCGCFRLSFAYHHWLLKASSWATRFNFKYFQFGDQSLFISKKIFQRLGGYNTAFSILEDVEIVNRIKKNSDFIIIPEQVVSSARRYIEYGILKTEFMNILIMFLYLLGCNQKKLLKVYHSISK